MSLKMRFSCGRLVAAAVFVSGPGGPSRPGRPYHRRPGDVSICREQGGTLGRLAAPSTGPRAHTFEQESAYWQRKYRSVLHLQRGSFLAIASQRFKVGPVAGAVRIFFHVFRVHRAGGKVAFLKQKAGFWAVRGERWPCWA